MKINRYISVLILLLVISLNSCYEDLGNYEYNRLDEIEVTNIEANYGSKELFVDSVIINPVVKFGEEGNEAFSGVWYMVTPGGLEPVSEGINLELPVTKSGLHNLILELTYNRLNLKHYVETEFEASSNMERGYYILKETSDGNTDMDVFMRVAVDSIQESFNLIGSVLKEPLPGKPVDIDYWDWIWRDETITDSVVMRTNRVIRPMSEKELAIFNVQDFSYLGDLDRILAKDIPMAERNLEGLISVNEMTLLFYNGGRMQILGNSGLFQTSHFISEFPGDYELEPCISSQRTGSGLLFDKASSSIVGLVGVSVSQFSILPDVAISMYPSFNFTANNGSVNGIQDVNLKYCGRANTNQRIAPLGNKDETAYFLFEKAQHPDSLLLYQLSLGPIAGGMDANFLSLMSIDTLDNAHNLKKAEHYAMNAKGEYLYFAKDSKVYYYNLQSMSDKELLDFGGEEITYLKHVKWSYDGDYNFDCLVVGTHSAGKYKLCFYEMSGALPTGETKHVLEGEGKVKSFVYASPAGAIENYYLYQ